MTREQLENLTEARKMHKLWIQAEMAIMTGQEYRIGTRFMRRADLREVASRIKFWADEVKRLEGTSRIHVQQIIPRDM